MASGDFNFTADGSLQGRIAWSSTSKGSTANASDVTATLYARRTDSYTTTGQSWSGYVKIGTAQTNIGFSSSVSVGNSWVQMATVTTTVAHNSSGAGTAAISGSVTGPSGTALAGRTSSGSQTVTLDTIPRYATGASFSLKSKTINSLTFTWSANETCSAIKYGTSSSSLTEVSVNAKTGNFTISNLSPNTSYTVYLNVKRKDSSLYLENNLSSSNNITYKIGTLVTVPNANIGAAQRITWENPSGAVLSLALCKTNNDVIIDYETVTGTETTVTPTANTIYALTPNSNTYTARYVLTTTANGQSYTNYKNFTFKVTNSNPNFSDFDYADTNSTTTALTGNPLILVKGYSNNQITISTSKKATAQNSATMKTYKVTQGTKSSSDLVYSSSAAVTTTLNAIDSNVIVVAATDSRGNSTSATKTLNSTYYKSYSPVTITSVTATRSNNGVGSVVTLKVNGTFWNNSFGSESNDIINARYQYKLSSSPSSSYGTMKSFTVTKSGNNFSFTGEIEGDLGSEGFDVENSYTIRVRIKDKLVETLQEVTIGSGTPGIAIYKNKVGIYKKYDTTEG